MPQGPSNIAEVLFGITWALITVNAWIQPHIRKAITSLGELERLRNEAGLTYVPGLLAVLTAAAPPPLQWFKCLSEFIPQNVWGIYVMVLEKAGFPPKIYIGSGTAAHRGLAVRIANHRSHTVSPVYVREAWLDGYETTRIAPLIWCPIPRAGLIYPHRIMFIALEATLSYVFWAMHHREKAYSYGDNCPWARELFEYEGLCSHNALLEPFNTGGKHFTEEQLEEMAAETHERNRLYQIEYQRNLRANATPQYKARQHANNIKQKPGTKARQQASVASKKYYCSTCDVSCRDNASLVLHNRTPRHLKRVDRGGSKDWRCDLCDITFKFESALKTHNTSKTHRENERVHRLFH